MATGPRRYAKESLPLRLNDAQKAIDAKYAQLPPGLLGPPTSDVQPTPDTEAFFRTYQFGAIYWNEAVDAHEVHGDIYAKWTTLGLQQYGLPLTDETGCPDGVGRFNNFANGGSIYWTPQIGAHEVHGAINARWTAIGREQSFLGYPLSDELPNPDPGNGRFSKFQNGFISWTFETGANEHRTGTQYAFSVDRIFVETTRSGNILGTAKDTDVLALQANVGAQTVGPQNTMLGDYGGGPHNVGVALNFAADDPGAPVMVSFIVTNSRDGITNQLEQGEQKGFNILTTAGAGAAGGAIGGPVGAAIGALLGAIAGAFGEFLFQNCDGVVAADTVHVSGATLNDQTAAAPHQEAKDYPGTDSPAGCGGNSLYNVAWTLTQNR